MTQEQKEGNRIIADFYEYYKMSGATAWCYDNNIMQFHLSFDWLNPVCFRWSRLFDSIPKEKIEEYLGLCHDLDSCAILYEIEPLFNQLVINIKWYNQNIKIK